MEQKLIDIAKQLKALGLRTLGAAIWVKTDATPKFADVTAEVQKNVVNGVTLASLKLPTGENGEFVSVRLAKGVPANKQSYNIFLYKAARNWPESDRDKQRFPNVTPIRVGDLAAFAE